MIGFDEHTLDMKLKNSLKKNSLKKNSLYYLIYNVINMVFPFAVGVYASRVLEPEGIGEVEAAKNLAQYFLILAFLGIPTYGLREIARSRTDRDVLDRIYSELFIINGISTIVSFIFFTVLVFSVPVYRDSFIVYFIFGLTVFFNIFNVSWLYEGLEEYRFIAIRNILVRVFSFGLLFVLVRNDTDIYQYATVLAVGTIGNSIINFVSAKRLVKFSIAGLNIWRHVKSIIILASVNIAIEIYTLMDITMMNFFCHKDSIAYYRYGCAIKNILFQIVNSFTIVIIPRISTLFKEGNYYEYNYIISRTVRIIILLSLPMIIGIWFIADLVIVQIYGVAFINSASILKILSISLIVSPLGYLLGSRVLLVTGHENKMIISVLSGALVNFVLNLILIPKYNEFGAAVASVVSELIVMIIYITMGRRLFSLTNVTESIKKAIVSVVAMTVYLLCCRQLISVYGYRLNDWIWIFIQVLGSIMVYFICLLFLKERMIIQVYCVLKNRIRQLK